jgi:hypothetical protein
VRYYFSVNQRINYVVNRTSTKQLRFSAICILICFYSAEFVGADTVVTLTPVADTSLFELNPDMNLGGAFDMPSGTTGAGERSRALIKFNVSQIPSNATVTSASISVTVDRAPSPGVGSIFGLYRILKDWVEGTGIANGSPANTNETTWNSRSYPNVPWTTPGAAAGTDYFAAFSATNFIDDLGLYTFDSTPGLVADVQSWVNSSADNFGWMLISQDEGTAKTARRFSSREYSDSNSWPALTINYTTPAAPNAPVITHVLVSGNRFQFSFNAESNRSYAVESRASAGSGPWSTLTNIAPQPMTSIILVSDPVMTSNRFYRVRTP